MYAELAAEILDLEKRLDVDGDVSSKPGPPASEAAIAAAEAARGRSFPATYRAFLAEHDGWHHFAWGTSLSTTEALTSKYSRGFLEDMIADGDDKLTGEVTRALVVGASENDAALVLLCDDGTVIDWLYESKQRWPSFDAYVADRARLLRKLVFEREQTELAIAREWTAEFRAESEAGLATELRAVLAEAPTLAPVKPPRVRGRKPAAKSATALIAKRRTKIVAEVVQHLVVYLGAYPSHDETLAAFRAWRAHYPIAGKLEWMRPGDFFMTASKDADAEPFADQLRVHNGHFGLRAAIDRRKAGRLQRYVLNVIGVPPRSDGTPRASFVEVIAPANEDPARLDALARDLVARLGVRSGHGGYAASIWDDDADPDPEDDVFAWCRRFFAVDIAAVDGWLTAARSRLHGAGWLTILGPAFAGELERVGRLKFGKGISIVRDDRAAVIRAGATPTLGDVARGEFPTQVAAVERAIAPLLIRGYDRRGWVKLGANYYTTLEDELPPMRSHHATAQFVARYLDPPAFLAETPRERAEALLAKLASPKIRKEWAAERRGGSPGFGVLMRLLVNATCGKTDVTEDDIVALELAVGYDERVQGVAMSQLLYCYLQLRRYDAVLARMPHALELAKTTPSILHNAACILARVGDRERAIECVRLAKQYGYADLSAIRRDDDLAPLCGTPAFDEIFADAG